MQSPFKFLYSYSLEDKDSFFGREKEILELYTMVNQNRLILVYGQSGVGKTSLVHCGLASQFETVDWYPLFIRRGGDINQSFQDVLEKALKAPLTETYTETLEELFALYVRPVYLLFDQFEELFILGTPEEQTIFFERIAEIVDALIPCRIIFILREEYLAHLYEFEKVIPSLLDRRLRVETMSYGKVTEVLQKSFLTFNIELENLEENTNQIIQNLSSSSEGIHLPYLQVYLDMLYRESFHKTYPETPPDEPFPPIKISTKDIESLGQIENVLDKFLEEQSFNLQRFLQNQYKNFPEDGVLGILDIFVTDEGTKRPVYYTREGEQLMLSATTKELLPKLDPGIISDCLQALEQLRLLRFYDNTMELSHDSLATLIDQRRTDEQRQLNTMQRQLKMAYLAHTNNTKDYLTRKELDAYEPFLPKLKLEQGLVQYLKDSKQHVLELEAAEEERKERELTLVREKLAAEQRIAKRQRIFTAITSILLIFSLGLSYYATTQSRALVVEQRNTQKALDNFRAAQAAGAGAEVREILERARALGQQNHLAQQTYLLLDAKSILDSLKDNKNEPLETLRKEVNQTLGISSQ